MLQKQVQVDDKRSTNTGYNQLVCPRSHSEDGWQSDIPRPDAAMNNQLCWIDDRCIAEEMRSKAATTACKGYGQRVNGGCRVSALNLDETRRLALSDNCDAAPSQRHFAWLKISRCSVVDHSQDFGEPSRLQTRNRRFLPPRTTMPKSRSKAVDKQLGGYEQ